MRLKTATFLFIITSLCISTICCTRKKAQNVTPNNKVELSIIGNAETFPALETMASLFHKQYPECKINYEYLQNYSQTLPIRLRNEKSAVDIFVSPNIQKGSPIQPYALELFSQKDKLDISQTFPGLIENFTYKDADHPDEKKIYSIPYGAELRGMFVNKTLLSKYNIAVPKNRAEFLAACEKLKNNGYTPIQGNPGNCPQWLLIPYVCNIVANNKNYDECFNAINSHQPGISEYFRDPMQFLYTLVQKDYYNYKYVENTYSFFKNASIDDEGKGFFNIVKKGSTYEKKDDEGTIAFMPAPLSHNTYLSKIKDDYHSKIEYVFILSPVGDNGGYVYLSPSDGFAINKNSKNIEWSLKFLNFLFEPDNNITFTKLNNNFSNTINVFAQVKEQFPMPNDHFAQLGSINFDYPFYATIVESIIEIAKANNPKYMQQNNDGTYSIRSFDYYMDNLSTRLEKPETGINDSLK